MKVTVHIVASIRRRVGRSQLGIFPPLLPDERKLRRRAPAFAIGCANGEDQVPLAKKRPISGKDRITCVVNAGCLRSRAVKLNDLKVFSGSQLFLAGVTDIVASDKKAGKLLRNV